MNRLRAGKPESRGSIPGRGDSFYLFHSVQTDSETHSASCLMHPGGCFFEAKRPERKVTSVCHLVPALRMLAATPPFLLRHYGVVLVYAEEQLCFDGGSAFD